MLLAQEGVANRSGKRQALFVFSFSLIALASIFFAAPAPAHAATLVQVTIGTAVTPTTTVTSAALSPAATAGNLLVAIVAANSATTITGPAGWSAAVNTSGTVSQGVFYTTAAGGETTISASVAANTGSIAIQVYEYSGSQTTFHLSNTAAGTGTTASTGSITTTQANELVIAGVVSQINTSPTGWTGGFTLRASFNVGGAAARRAGYGGADLLSGAAGSKSTTVTVGSAAWLGTIVSFYDNVAPTLAQVTPVSSPTSDATPNYTFSSDEAGTITYGGDCSSATTAATAGNNTITFNTLSDGLHSNCTIVVTDGAGNPSTALNVNAFTVDTSAPTVSNVTSSLANGAYTIGQAVPVEVNFSESVVVTGTPQIELSTGSPVTTLVNYSGGSGGTTLTFTYTVIAGNSTSDLDYASTGALTLNAGTIKDAAGNNAILTLASPGAAGSLGANKAIVIDTAAPTVTSVTSTHADGSFTVGEVIPVTVNFSEPVTSTGSVTVTLETGGTDRACAFSVSNASSGTCNYTVQAGDTSSDLTTNSIAGTIKDSALNAMTNFTPASNLAASSAIVIDTAAPTVTSVTSTHADGSFTVGEVIPVTVNFSEPVTSTGSVTVTLETGGTDRACAFSVSNASSGTCNYTVQAGDASSDLTTNSIAGTIKDSALNAMVNFTPATNLAATKAIVIDTTAPTVISTSPTSGATDVAVGVSPSATFSEAMDSLTITTSTFTLKQGLTPVSGVVSYGAGTATFNPDADLTPSIIYTAEITVGAKDPAGNPLASPYIWNFTTGTVDTTPPTVTSTDPADLATAVPVNQVLTVNFSETMDTGTITTGSFTLKQGLTPISGTVNPVGSTATFTPSSPLSSSTVYTATLTAAIKDLAGNPLAAPYSWSFTTADVIAPTVSNVTSSLANGAYTVGQIVPVQVVFNEVVIVSGTPQITLSTGSPATTLVNISGGSNSTTITFNYSVIDGNVSADLDYASTGALILNGGTIRDAAGNDATLTLASPGAAGSLGANKDIEINTHIPTIVSVTSTHADGSFTVGEVIPVTVNFSEPVTSTGSVTVTLETGGTDRTCAFSVSNASSGTCNYTVQSGDASSDLTTNSIAGTIKDSALNAMVNFTPATNLAATKAIVIDTTAPTVSSTSPSNGATGAALNVSPVATFSEAMDSLTITTSTFTLKQGLTPVSGVVSYLGLAATFNPDADLSPSTVYTATITIGAKDPTGNPMSAPYSWSFTTGSGPDLTPPTVSSTNPLNGATSVSVSQVVSVLFDETMDTGTITTVTFTLKRGLTAISGVVSYVGGVATFTPSGPLSAGTVYTADLTTGIKDLAGNPLAAPYSWRFTTADEGAGGAGTLYPVEMEVGILPEACTTDRDVQLLVHAHNAVAVKISNLPDLSDAEWQTYAVGIERVAIQDWTLMDGDGVKTVYIVFKSPFGLESEVQKITLRLDKASQCSTVEAQAHIVGPEGEIEPAQTDPRCLSDFAHATIEPYIINPNGKARGWRDAYVKVTRVSAVETRYAFEDGGDASYDDIVVHVERIGRGVHVQADKSASPRSHDIMLRVDAADRGRLENRLLWRQTPDAVLPPYGFSLGQYPELCDANLVPHAHPGDLLKGVAFGTYYLGRDWKRHAFPSQSVFESWYPNGGADVKTVADYQLASIPLGGNVTFRPGHALARISGEPVTYAVDFGQRLRPFVSDSITQVLFGPFWKNLIRSLDPAFVTGYVFGPPIISASDPVATPINSASATIDAWPMGGGKYTTHASSILDRRVVFERAPYRAGEVELRFRMLDKDGRSITSADLAASQEKLVHLMIARDDLSVFQHVHPEERDGVWSVRTIIPDDGRYYLYVDMLPIKEPPAILRAAFVIGENPPIGRDYPSPDPSMAATVGPIKASLEAGKLIAGAHLPMKFSLTQDGKPYGDIRMWIGAYGHLVILKQHEPNVFVHTHPTEDAAPADGVMTFEARFPSPGRYTIFPQFDTGGTIRAFPITVDVAAASATDDKGQ